MTTARRRGRHPIEVPLTRRLLGADRRRVIGSIAGVGLALMLILLLDGLSTGIDSRITVYEERSGAPVFVGQPGTTSFLGSTSSIPRSTVDTVRAQPDVTWAAAVRGFFTVPQINGTRIPSYVVGWEPGQAGGPWSLDAGRVPRTDDEIAVGEQFAQRGGVRVGGTVDLFGRPYRVVGIASDADMFMASFVFMTHGATDALLGSPATTSFVLVGTDQPEAVLAQLRSVGLHAVSRETLQRNDLALKGQAYSVGLNLMVGIAFAVGTLVIAMTIYAAVLERRRDYGIIKAIGATRVRLFRLVLSQSLLLAVVGLVAGAAFFVAGSAVLGVSKPQFAISLTTTSVVRIVLAALVMAGAATIVPARRLAAMEPATAFRGA